MPKYAAGTEVPSDRTRAEIERTLRRYGATAFAYGWEGETAQIAFKLAGRQIRFRLPLPDPEAREFTGDGLKTACPLWALRPELAVRKPGGEL